MGEIYLWMISRVVCGLWMIGMMVESTPLVYTIERGEKECLYETLHAGERVTQSVFIRTGMELTAHVNFEGPLALESVKSGPELMHAVQLIESGTAPPPNLSLHHFVDYEDLPHLFTFPEFMEDSSDEEEEEMEEDVDDMYYYYDMEEPDPEWIGQYDDDTLTEAERENMKASDREMYQERLNHWKDVRAKKALQKSQKRSHKALTAARKRRAEIMEMAEGGPWQHTVAVNEPGWYRLCVSSKHHKISAEIELRKESEVGHPNRNTGHLMTYERFEMLKEERKQQRQQKALEKQFADLPETDAMVGPHDVERINQQLKQIHRVLQNIREQQATEERRLAFSTTVNEHTHARMVVYSLMETCLYIGVSVYQVYTIRRWFSGGPMLGY